jgi:stage IV sporulation protein B
MYIARGREVKKGTAYIYSRLLGELRKYEIEIEQVDRWSGDKNVEFHVVDEDLLTLTGGVVQGMSGSPIVQDGKLIGAVTHVFVDDPTRGYGIFIEEMVKE